MSKPIPLTRGRVVYFLDSAPSGDKEPKVAIICHVHNEGMVNLCVFDESGNPSPRTSVPFVQPDTKQPTSGSYAHWMPYQVQNQKVNSESAEPRPVA